MILSRIPRICVRPLPAFQLKGFIALAVTAAVLDCFSLLLNVTTLSLLLSVSAVTLALPHLLRCILPPLMGSGKKNTVRSYVVGGRFGSKLGGGLKVRNLGPRALAQQTATIQSRMSQVISGTSVPHCLSITAQCI